MNPEAAIDPSAPGPALKIVPRIAITAGEPAGIGPDLLVALAQQGHPAELIAIADPDLLTARAALLGLPLVLDPWDPTVAAQAQTPGRLRCLAAARLPAPVQPGRLDPANARYVLATLAAAADGCLRGDFAAMVTAPVHKGIINDAGLAFSGHTEFLAEHCARWLIPPGGRSPEQTAEQTADQAADQAAGAPADPAGATIEPVMLLTAPGLRVALATTHLPLAAVPAALTAPRLERVLSTLAQALRRRFGIQRPRILVCGLNPHAGEGGHLGLEEQAVIIPVLDALRATGLDLIGPLPADTAFVPSRLAGADAVLAMYHDQGLPVLKHLGFGQAVNVTLGLPIIRTSVDHGTALDLAGTGRADLGSLRAALALALEMAGSGGSIGGTVGGRVDS